jgi:hypothetical protein
MDDTSPCTVGASLDAKIRNANGVMRFANADFPFAPFDPCDAGSKRSTSLSTKSVICDADGTGRVIMAAENDRSASGKIRFDQK